MNLFTLIRRIRVYLYAMRLRARLAQVDMDIHNNMLQRDWMQRELLCAERELYDLGALQ
jgi:hypothetical protein